MAVAAANRKRKGFESSKSSEVSKKKRRNPIFTMSMRSAIEFLVNRRGFLRFRSLPSSSLLKRKKKTRDRADDSTRQVFDGRFQPVDEEEKAQIEHAFSEINRMKVLVSHQNSNTDIKGGSLQCLMPTGWLNDEVIDLYLELMKEREARDPIKYPKCHFFNSFFYTKLLGKDDFNYNYNAVRRWTTKKKLGYDLIDCHMIFIPIHRGIHWTLAVINTKECKFMYLDSLSKADPTIFLNPLTKYLVDEVKDKSGKGIDVSSWASGSVENIPKQYNSYDCGMFMLKYIDFYSRGLSLDFCQKDIPYFRLRIAKEILRLRVD